MINVSMCEVDETYNMIGYEKLDVRTIVLGISPLECVNSNLEALNEKIYKKITTLAENLVSAGQDIEADLGIPIVNKRISVALITLVGGSTCGRPKDFVTIAKTLDIATEEVDVNFIGGYSALMSKGMTRADKSLILSIPQALSQTECVCSSVSVDSTKAGIDMDAVELMSRIVTEIAEATRDHDSLGCAKLVIFCNAPGDNPFMADVFHGVIESEAIISVGVGGPGAVKTTLAKVRDINFEMFYETTEETAFKTTRVGQLVTQGTSRHMGTPFGIIDLSLTPTSSMGDSVAEILEEIGLEHMDAPRTTATLAMFNDQVRKDGVVASSYVGGLSGAFTPASENQGMIDAASIGALTIEKLEAMAYVYSIGLDMTAIPSDTPSNAIAGIIADEAAIRMVNQKMTAVRLIPVVGKKVGETAEFSGLLGYAPAMPVNTFSCRRFVTGDERIPAPIHGLKN